jgi:lysophospholipase L1-like esterase
MTRTWTQAAIAALTLACGCASPPTMPRVPRELRVATAAVESEPDVDPPVPVDAPAVDPDPTVPPIPVGKGTRVLIFGDSMVTSGLGTSLQARVVARGGKFFSVSKGSSTSRTWNESHELEELLVLTHPDVVIVVLGSNELFVPNPRARIHDIQGVVRRIGARRCLWIGPSPWRPEKGIVGVVRESASPCRFFDSTPVDIVKGADGIHPTIQGGRAWADAVWQGSFAE